jgi:hypothetical protein
MYLETMQLGLRQGIFTGNEETPLLATIELGRIDLHGATFFCGSINVNWRGNGDGLIQVYV